MPLGISGGAVVDPVAAPQEKAQCPGVGLPDSDLGEVVLGHGMLKQAASQPLLSVSGVGEVKARKYGAAFLAVLARAEKEEV